MNKKTIYTILVLAVVVVIAILTYRNNFSPKEVEALVIDEVIKEKITSLSSECLTVINTGQKLDTITFEVREKHGGNCGGDPNTSPLVTTAEVNIKTGEVTIQAQPKNILTEDEVLKLIQEQVEVKAWVVSLSSKGSHPVFEVVVDGDMYDVKISEEKNGQKTFYQLYFVDMKTGEVSYNAEVE